MRLPLPPTSTHSRLPPLAAIQVAARGGTEDAFISTKANDLPGPKHTSEGAKTQAEQYCTLHISIQWAAHNRTTYSCYRNDLVSEVTDIALSIQNRDPTLCSTIVMMGQSLVRYEKEMQKLARQNGSMQVRSDATQALQRSEERYKLRQSEGLAEDMPIVKEIELEDDPSTDRWGSQRSVRTAIAEEALFVGGFEKQVTSVARKEFVNLKEWPLPPTMKGWNRAAGERKRKRRTK